MAQLDLIGVNEAAEIIGCSPRTVKRLLLDGRLPYAHKGNGRTSAYLLDPTVVELFARQRKAA